MVVGSRGDVEGSVLIEWFYGGGGGEKQDDRMVFRLFGWEGSRNGRSRYGGQLVLGRRGVG